MKKIQEVKEVKEVNKAVIFCRVSSEKQEDGNSLEAQLRINREYCKKNNFEIIREFSDVDEVVIFCNTLLESIIFVTNCIDELEDVYKTLEPIYKNKHIIVHSLDTVFTIDNNIIDELLKLDDKNADKLKSLNVTLQTSGRIFQETNAVSDEKRRIKLLRMYPKFKIINISDNMFPLCFPVVFYSKESWDFFYLLQKDKTVKAKHTNDHILAMISYTEQKLMWYKRTAYLVTNDKVLTKSVMSHGVNVIDSFKFLELINE